MDLRKDGLIAKFYGWSYSVGSTYRTFPFKYKTREYPTSFCPFFWQLVFALLVAPITWWSAITDYVDRATHIGFRIMIGLVGYLLLGILVLIGAGIYAAGWALITVGGQILWYGLLAGIVILPMYYFFCRSYIWPTLTNKTTDLANDILDIVFTKKESVTNKYCPKITWK